MKLLVAYASKYGSTAEIAEVIGKELQKRHHEVEVKLVDEVGSVDGFDGFIIGSAVYAGGWMKPADKFLRTHLEVLAHRPTWLFSSGPTGEGDPNEIMDGWTFPENLGTILKKIRPKDVILFHGNINLDRLSATEQMILRSVKATTGDYRDWLVIRSWAGKIDLDLKDIAV